MVFSSQQIMNFGKMMSRHGFTTRDVIKGHELFGKLLRGEKVVNEEEQADSTAKREKSNQESYWMSMTPDGYSLVSFDHYLSAVMRDRDGNEMGVTPAIRELLQQLKAAKQNRANAYLTGADKYEAFCQLLFNEMGVSKDDIRAMLMVTIEKQAVLMVENTFNDFDMEATVQKLIKDQVVNRYGKDRIAEEIAKHVSGLVDVRLTGDQS